MRILEARNAHTALPLGIELLQQWGQTRNSRNGSVVQAPWPVATVYGRPTERCVFWTDRDYNPAFVLYESLWMLAGRQDVEPLTRYVKDFAKYSDDGQFLHGAYGYRWRQHFGTDQLHAIAETLRENALDRRSVLQMWDCIEDLEVVSKDVPCNVMATFQRDVDGRLNMVVFCRSNDIIWGTYYANAFHFGMLLEYMAHRIGCAVGTYTQVSVNYHAYLTTLAPLTGLPKLIRGLHSVPTPVPDPYRTGEVVSLPMVTEDDIDDLIVALVDEADSGFHAPDGPEEPWARSIWAVLRAHHHYKLSGVQRAYECLAEAGHALQTVDWIVSMWQWLQTRERRGHQE
jgi:thymidylate synthase